MRLADLKYHFRLIKKKTWNKTSTLAPKTAAILGEFWPIRAFVLESCLPLHVVSLSSSAVDWNVSNCDERFHRRIPLS